MPQETVRQISGPLLAYGSPTNSCGACCPSPEAGCAAALLVWRSKANLNEAHEAQQFP